MWPPPQQKSPPLGLAGRLAPGAGLLALVGCASCVMACADAVGVPIRIAAASKVDSSMPMDASAEADAGEPTPPDAAEEAGHEEAGHEEAGHEEAGQELPWRSNEVPNTDYCEPVAEWPPEQSKAEMALLEAINEFRAGTENCEGRVFYNLPPFRLSPELRCSARLMSMDLAEQGVVDPGPPDRDRTPQRMMSAGIVFGDERVFWGELYETGSDPSVVLRELLQTNRGCTFLAEFRFTAIGIGYHEGLWTIDLVGF